MENYSQFAYASRSLTKSEQNYGQIDKEALAITWACERFYMYILGKHITLETDHKPLIPLFSTKHLSDIPIRIQRFRIRLMRYDYNIVHVPGKELIVADTLSRAPRVSTDGGELRTGSKRLREPHSRNPSCHREKTAGNQNTA